VDAQGTAGGAARQDPYQGTGVALADPSQQRGAQHLFGSRTKQSLDVSADPIDDEVGVDGPHDNAWPWLVVVDQRGSCHRMSLSDVPGTSRPRDRSGADADMLSTIGCLPRSHNDEMSRM
jgi:hypothetical protein